MLWLSVGEAIMTLAMIILIQYQSVTDGVPTGTPFKVFTRQINESLQGR